MHNAKDRLDEALEKGRCVPILGAGVSMAAGGPNWKGHLQQLCEDFDDRNLEESKIKKDLLKHFSTGMPLIDIASRIMSARKHFHKPPMLVTLRKPGVLHQTLASLSCPIYLTTNFDNGLEQAFNEQRVNYTALNNDQLDRLDVNNLKLSPYIVRLCSSSHGSVGGALTNRDFAELIHSNSAGLKLLQIILHDSVCLFVGCSMKDPLIKEALQRSSYSGIGHSRHVAIMSDMLDSHEKRELEDYGVDLELFSPNQMTTKVGAYIGSLHGGKWPPVSRRNRLLIFEPGPPAKAQLILEAIKKVLPTASLSHVGVITERQDVLDIFEEWRIINNTIETIIFKVNDVSNTRRVIEEVIAYPFSWNAVLSINELTMEYAAAFSEEYKTQLHLTDILFLPKHVVDLSREKIKFRTFVESSFPNHSIIATTPFMVLSVRPQQDKALKLLTAIKKRKNQNRGWIAQEVVVKPVDAAGSRGVRPISLAANRQEKAIEALNDLKGVLMSMSNEFSTRRCCTTQILVEERLTGEEFSVEGRVVEGKTEIFCVHWKPGIDADRLRFFERIYVTLPSNTRPYALLHLATTEILERMNPVNGVFHAEFRASQDGERVYPLEIGLRPGGGSVGAQVMASCGIDLFEASVRASLGMAQSLVIPRQNIVASAEIFADVPGVLPPMQMKLASGKYCAIRAGDEPHVASRLNDMLYTTDRSRAQKKLEKLLDNGSTLSVQVFNAFASKGTGLRAKVNSFDIWMRPGDVVAEEEATYLAGMRIIADPALKEIEAVAETIAAIEMCYECFMCKPIPALR